MVKALRTPADLQRGPIWISGELDIIDIQDLVGLRLITIGMRDVCIYEPIT